MRRELNKRLGDLEKRVAEACPGCARWAEWPVFLDADGERLPNSRPATCPVCGRRFTSTPKIYGNVDLDRV